MAFTSWATSVLMVVRMRVLVRSLLLVSNCNLLDINSWNRFGYGHWNSSWDGVGFSVIDGVINLYWNLYRFGSVGGNGHLSGDGVWDLLINIVGLSVVDGAGNLNWDLVGLSFVGGDGHLDFLMNGDLLADIVGLSVEDGSWLLHWDFVSFFLVGSPWNFPVNLVWNLLSDGVWNLNDSLDWNLNNVVLGVVVHIDRGVTGVTERVASL